MNDVPDGVPSPPGLAGGPVHLDHNATTPVAPRVAAAMLPHLTDFYGNPSSSHPCARAPRRALDKTRAQTADLIGARADGIVFSASASEADLLALRGTVPASDRPTRALRLPLGRPDHVGGIETATAALIRAALPSDPHDQP
ncbi:aminotransferase class V-fold PLP-dependent enzyme [Streptomyces vietnamensis]|uniref:aminotransferase class V-fold PLP-dependent enzyme n=1 Tax=Streptomyces vietnamensis TaxID=362257 RepID=UPI0037A97148